MKTSLSERYITATINELPAEMHDDVRAELEASIADAIMARIEQGEVRKTAERAVLTELGDPSLLAANYADRPLHLIGPRYYLTWWRLLKRLLVIIPPIVFVIVAFAQVLAGGNIGDILAEAIVATISTILHVCFWVTLTFVIIERSGGDLGISWSVDNLPEPQDARRGKGDFIASLVFIGLMLAALIWDQTRAFIHIEGESVAVLNPELWPWAMISLFGLLVVEAIFALVLYTRGGWNFLMAAVNTLLSMAFFSWFITLLVRGELFSAEFTNLWSDNGVHEDNLYTLAVIFGFGVAVIAIWDIIDGWVRATRANRAAESKRGALAT